MFQIVLLQEVDERSKSFPDLSGSKNQDIFAQPNQREMVGPKAKKYFQQNNLMKESIPLSPIDKVSERAGLFSSPSTAVTPEDAQAQKGLLENQEAKANLGTPEHCSIWRSFPHQWEETQDPALPAKQSLPARGDLGDHK